MAVWKERKVWRARITQNGKHTNLGTYKTKKEALRAVDNAREIVTMPFEDFKSGFRQSKPSWFSKLIARFKR